MMKKFIWILSLFFTIVILNCVTAYADIRVINDGMDIEFDVSPQIMNDRTMVPLRKIFETLGANVEWNPQDSSISSAKDSNKIYMQVGNQTMKVNGKDITLDSPPVIIDGRTLVPVRAVAESFNIRTSWDPIEEAVVLSQISKSENGSHTFDEEKYELKKPGIKTVNIGKTTYAISVPDGMALMRRRDFMDGTLFSDNVLTYNDEITMNFNTGAYENKNGLFKSFDEFYNDYHLRWPSSQDTYENIYFEYKVDGNYEIMSYINKHITPFMESTDPEIRELQRMNDELAKSLGTYNERVDEVVYEGKICIANLSDYTDVGTLSIEAKDEEKINVIKQIINSMNIGG